MKLLDLDESLPWPAWVIGAFFAGSLLLGAGWILWWLLWGP